MKLEVLFSATEIASFVPGFIQGWRTWGESKISSFVSSVNQENEEMGWVQDFLM